MLLFVPAHGYVMQLGTIICPEGGTQNPTLTLTLTLTQPRRGWICFTTMKLVKPVTWRNISSCLVLPPEIVMQDAFNVILRASANICIVHDNLGWKNRTTRYNCRFSAALLALRVIFLGGTTEQHVTIGCSVQALQLLHYQANSNSN